jgi:integrase
MVFPADRSLADCIGDAWEHWGHPRSLGYIQARGRHLAEDAKNLWSFLTVAFKAAQNAKQRDLRVREDNLTANVLPPDDGPSKKKFWLWPTEASSLFAEDSVPLEWRRIYAIALYTGLRPEELCELRWMDVDLRVGELHVRRTFKRALKQVALPKTNASLRSLPIEAALLPLLTAMRGKDEDLVCPALKGIHRTELARWFRNHLVKAPNIRKEIFIETKSHDRIAFRALRNTYATWSAIAGYELSRVSSRMGHETLETTRGYYREVEDRPAVYGAPFPHLDGLFAPSDASTQSVHSGPKAQPLTFGPAVGPVIGPKITPTPLFQVGSMASPRGFEPLLATWKAAVLGL